MIGKSQQNNLKNFWTENQHKHLCTYQWKASYILGFLNHMQILIPETRIICAENIYGILSMWIKLYKYV